MPFYWDPPREMFKMNIPLLDRPILWYGFFFALGFLVGYWILLSCLRNYFQDRSHKITAVAERLTVYVILGTVIGARLGDLIFYQHFSEYLSDPLSIIQVWKGGLASHGGAIGILVALLLFSKRIKSQFPKLSFLRLLDFTVIPAAFAAGMIRLGNFVNQEILGTETHLPWAIVFGHPADGSAQLPRHPVQLYEALYYFLVFIALYIYMRITPTKAGRISGLFLVLVFVFRFFIEYLKVEQSALLSSDSALRMGQMLSLPFILLGLFLIMRREKDRKG